MFINKDPFERPLKDKISGIFTKPESERDLLVTRFAQKCCDLNPDERPTAEQIVNEISVLKILLLYTCKENFE